MPNNYSDFIQYWSLDQDMVFLNHGSFGACPQPILEIQQYYRDLMESQPLRFIVRELPALLQSSKAGLADFVGSNPTNIAFVKNATTGVNTILRSLKFNPGDEIIITNHIYPACRNAVEYISSIYGVKIREALIPFNLESEQQLLEAVFELRTQNTKLVVVDHITSPTGLLFPVKEIVDRFKEFEIDTLVDGAHAPGTIPLNLEDIGAAYYTGNCHKWICSPKGSAFLYVHPDKQDKIFPLTISLISGKSKSFEERFSWQGTEDPSAYLCVGETIDFMDSIFPGGWTGIMKHNNKLANEGRQLLCDTLKIQHSCPDYMIANLASVKLPDSLACPPTKFNQIDPLQDKLYHEFQTEVFITYWPSFPKRLIRISPQIYNTIEQYTFLADTLKQQL